jgi:hypothetical protein
MRLAEGEAAAGSIEVSHFCETLTRKREGRAFHS